MSYVGKMRLFDGFTRDIIRYRQIIPGWEMQWTGWKPTTSPDVMAGTLIAFQKDDVFFQGQMVAISADMREVATTEFAGDYLEFRVGTGIDYLADQVRRLVAPPASERA